MTTITRKCEECGTEFEQTEYTEAYEADGPYGVEIRPAKVYKLCKCCVAKIPDPMADTFKFLGIK